MILLISASWVARITGVSHWCPDQFNSKLDTAEERMNCYTYIFKNYLECNIVIWGGRKQEETLRVMETRKQKCKMFLKAQNERLKRVKEMWLFLSDSYYLFIFIVLGYIVGFTKVLTIYQVYHSWIHPLHLSPLSPPHPWNSFNRSHFSIYIHVCTVFGLYSSLYTLCPHPPPPTVPTPDTIFSALLFSDYVKEKHDIFVCLK
jgi:hypothetical protein